MSSSKKRRLAAIMFADIVGYTAMMQQNESKAAQIIQRFHQLLKDKVAQFNGQIIQFYGDGCLGIFDSSVDAVHCGIDVQLACKEGMPIPLRIGLHSGDIFMQDENIFGDSVNITSRIESMGVPGAILLTKKLRDEVKNHPEFQLSSLGFFEFKNLEESIEVFAVANEGLTVPNPKNLKGKFKETTPSTNTKKWLIPIIGLLLLMAASLVAFNFFSDQQSTSKSENKSTEAPIPVKDFKSIAILPFDNINGTSEKDYLSSGFSDEVRSRLASLKNIKVISRSSSVFYKSQEMPLVEIGKKLSATHILTGQVKWIDNKIIVNVELNNAKNDELEWSAPFEINQSDLSSLEPSITAAVIEQMKLPIDSEQSQALANVQPVAADIYDKWLRSWHYLQDYTPDKIQKAYQIAENIIKEDSTYASAYYVLGYTHLINAVWFGSSNPSEDLEKAERLFSKGIAIDPNNALCYEGMSNVKLFYNWDFESSEEAVQKALSLGGERAALSAILIKFYNGEFDTAIERLAHHKEIDPLSIYHDFIQGRILFFKGKTERAKKILRDGIRLYGLVDYYHSLGKVYLNTGDFGLAIPTLEKGLQELGKNHPPLMADLAIAYAKKGEKERVNQVLEILETIYNEGGGGSPAFYCGQIYSGLGETEKAFEWLEKAFDRRETEMVWLKIEPQFDNLRQDPRFNDLIQRVGFPEVLLN